MNQPEVGNDEAHLAAWGWLDGLLVLLVLVLAGLLGSAAIRNSDIWLHLATGRAIAAGEYRFGADPFSASTSDPVWVNHAWLFDFGIFELFHWTGPRGLAIGRAIHVVLIFAVVLLIRRRRSSLALPVAGTTLALLASNSRLPWFQPIQASYLWIAVYLLLFHIARSSWRSWLVPAICFAIQVHWANHDGWFFLGPALIVLWIAGSLLQEKGADELSISNWAVALAASLLGCLVNPHLLRVFSWPDELVPAFFEPAVRNDPLFVNYFAGMFDGGFDVRAGAVPADATYALLALGVASFVVAIPQRPWRRLVIWSVLAALAIWRSRLVPFFAVGGTPLMVMNFQDAIAHRTWDRWPSWLGLMARATGVVALASLIFAAWPGWLGPKASDPRLAHRVNPTIEPDLALEQMAKQVGDWQSRGQLTTDDRCFNSTPDVAHYLAWFSPKTRTLFDSRWSLFHKSIAGVSKARTAVESLANGQVDLGDLESAMAQHSLTFLVLSSGEGSGAGPALTMWGLAERFPFWALAGRVTAFGYVPAGAADRRPQLKLDLARRTFEPQSSPNRPAPPIKDPNPPTFWEQYRSAPPRTPVELDSAETYLSYAQFNGAVQDRDFLAIQVWGGGASVGLGTAPTFVHPLIFTQWAANGISPSSVFGRTDAGAIRLAALLHAIRLARAAQLRVPADPNVYLRIAEAYRGIIMPPTFGRLRFADSYQRFPAPPVTSRMLVATAWTQTWNRLSSEQQSRVNPVAALSIADGLASYHLALNQIDLGADAVRNIVQLMPFVKTLFGDEKTYAQQYERRRKQLEQLEGQVKARRVKLENDSADKPVGFRVFLAEQLGLPGDAIATADQALAQTSMADAQIDMPRLLDVMIRAGRADDARAILNAPGFDPMAAMDPSLQPEIHRLRMLAAAACGDLTRTNEEIPVVIAASKSFAERDRTTLGAAHALAALAMAPDAHLNHPTALFGIIRFLTDSRATNTEWAIQISELQTWAGIFALEAGDTRAAMRWFTECATDPTGFMRELAEHYRSLLARYEP